MKSTPSKIRRQGGDGDSPRAALSYAQIPLALLCLPAGERSAAIEVWAALHHHLRLGSRPERITDEELAGVPWLIERSRRYRCNGLDTLERLGLITRDATGSSRRVAIAAKLRGQPSPSISVRSPVNVRQSSSDPRHVTNPVDVAKPLDDTEFWDRLNRTAPTWSSVHRRAQKRES